MNSPYETALSLELFLHGGSEYEGTQDHSDWVDDVLGVNVLLIENDLIDKARARLASQEGSRDQWGRYLHRGIQTWVGLDPRQLQTPYFELVNVCQLLLPKKGQHVIDLGSAYGRLGLVLSQFSPQCRFTGIEYVSERVAEANRIFKKWKCNNALSLEQDLFGDDFILPVADYYMLYDYGRLEHIRRTLSQMQEIARHSHFKLVARGRGCRTLINHMHPWLFDITPPNCNPNFAIYGTKS